MHGKVGVVSGSRWNGIVGEETNYVCGLIIAFKINLSDETRVWNTNTNRHTNTNQNENTNTSYVCSLIIALKIKLSDVERVWNTEQVAQDHNIPR